MEHRPGKYRPEPDQTSQPELTQPQNQSALRRAVERTRDLYEKNGWVFLPLGQAGHGSLGVPTIQGEQPPDSAAQEHGELQADEQAEAEEFDFDLGEFPGPAIWKCSLPYPSHSKSNEEPGR